MERKSIPVEGKYRGKGDGSKGLYTVCTVEGVKSRLWNASRRRNLVPDLRKSAGTWGHCARACAHSIKSQHEIKLFLPPPLLAASWN